MKSEIVKKRLGKIYVFIIVGIFLLIASALAIVSGDDDDWYDQNNLGIPPTSINDHIYTYGSVAITEIDEENPLGIGASKLVIYDDNGGIANVRFVDEDTGTGMGDGIIVGIDENHDGIIWNYEDADIGFGIGDQEIMTIENELEVGIGTTNPSARLEVNPTVTSNQNYYGIKSGITYNGDTMTNWYGMYVEAPAPAGTGTITNEYALVTEADAGNVGIGTTNPSKELEVNGDCKIKGWLDVAETSDTGIKFLSDPVITSSYNEMKIYLNTDDLGTADDASFSIFRGDTPLEVVKFEFRSTMAEDNSWIIPVEDFGIGTNAPSTKLHINGDVAFGAGSELTLSGDSVSITHSYHTIDTEGDDATDDLDRIFLGDVAGQILFIRAAHDDRDVKVTDSAVSGGNIILSGGNFFLLDDLDDTLVLFYDGSNWLELSRSDNS